VESVYEKKWNNGDDMKRTTESGHKLIVMKEAVGITKKL
jgi:hypothetical protein